MIGKLIKLIFKAFVYFVIICIIGAINPYLLIPTFIIVIVNIYRKGTFTNIKNCFDKIKVKNNIKKKYRNIKFINEIELYEENIDDLVYSCKKDFDKDILNYKKNYICLTKDKIIFIGYIPKFKNESELYIRDYKISNIEEINMGFWQKEYKHTTYETKVSYRTVRRNDYTYNEEVSEQVPVEETRIGTHFSYITIKFKDIKEKKVLFNFGKQEFSLQIPYKFKNTCRNIGIKNIIDNKLEE